MAQNALTTTHGGGQVTTVDPAAAFDTFIRRRVARGNPSQDTIDGYTREATAFRDWLQRRGSTVYQATEDDILDYRGEMIAAGRKPSTIRYKLAVVRRVLDAGMAEGVLTTNAASHVDAPRERSRPEDRICYFSEAELDRLFSHIATGSMAGLRDRAIVALMALHGLRQVEVHRASVGDLYQDGDAPALYVHGKGHDRIVYLRQDTAAALQAWLSVRGHLGNAAPLFCSLSDRSRGGRLTRRAIRTIVVGYYEAAGLRVSKGTRQVSTHTLRHTFATLARANGASNDQIQEQGGWRDARMLDRYAHVMDRIANNPSNAIPIKI